MYENIKDRHQLFRKSNLETNRPFSSKKVIIYAIIVAVIVLVGAIFVFL